MCLLSSRWGYGIVSATDTGTKCDPRCSRMSNNTPTLLTSSACWSMQAWLHLVVRLGYRPYVGSVCWGSVPKIAADDCCVSCHRCLFYVAICSSGNPAVFFVPSTVGVVGGIVPFLVALLASYLGQA